MKRIILLLVTVGAAFVFWMVTKPLFEQSFDFQNIGSWLWPLGFLAAFVGLQALVFLLLDRKIVWLSVFLGLGVFAFVFNPKEILVWAGVAIALLLQWSAWRAIKGESQNKLRFHLRSNLHSGMGRLVTSILILISFAYFLNSGIREEVRRRELPNFVRQTVQVVVGNYVDENLEAKSPSLRAQLTEKVLDQITNYLKPYFVVLPPILTFGLFLILQGLSFIFVWLGMILAMLIFRVLKILKLVKIEVESREAEILKF
ncbi:MAG: hypothetical protein A3I92_02150 [Candidatus Yanofskybacteria bacterium RIFCSPLOWO2_02_FULL_43_10b]|uniref:Uncharacterized protein n=1 Tax=Candidatus Yanofskybacteria bacterium RIFCSPLOWO2_02_FULL_43_10b TaxID=1802704 RepID=A0A1F8H5Y7_9BACT|nr:MAG: hypothetical protein A3I92_02150 [Candidatus Yanofskybacteria bacterium RIFCSPLOWO2_02_FULL_43_10b]